MLLALYAKAHVDVWQGERAAYTDIIVSLTHPETGGCSLCYQEQGLLAPSTAMSGILERGGGSVTGKRGEQNNKLIAILLKTKFFSVAKALLFPLSLSSQTKHLKVPQPKWPACNQTAGSPQQQGWRDTCMWSTRGVPTGRRWLFDKRDWMWRS